MLLDRIDIDSHGPLARVTLGPFSQTLNVIVAASGSGKTALVRFLRDSLTGTTPARDGLAQSIGRVVWSAADGFYHCRRTPNGTAQGHRHVEFETRFAGAGATDVLGNSRFARESIVVDLPSCVVDGIVTDTRLTSVQHCIQAAIASGLDHANAASGSSREAEITELERQIHSLTLHSQHASARHANAYESFGLTLDMKRLRDRRAELSLEITAIDARRDWTSKSDAEMDRRRGKRELFASVADEIERLRRQEADLRSRLAEVDSALEKMDDDERRAKGRAAIAKAYRDRVEQVDVQLVRVRKVVREIRALGDHWFGGRGLTAQAGWLEQAIDRNGQITDNFSLDHDTSLAAGSDDCGDLNITDRGWSSALASSARGDHSAAASTVDVQRRIDAICRLVDNLVGRCEEHQTERVYPQSSDKGHSRLTDWDSWAQSELDRHERRRSDLDQTSHVDPADVNERFEPISSLDRAESLLQAERTYRAHSLTQTNENVAWIAGVLNGVSQRLRGVAGRRAAYGSSNLDPLFDARRDEHGFDDSAKYEALVDPQAQLAAVRRCERELVEVLRHLALRRDVMLRRIAELQHQPFSQVVSTISDAQVSYDDPQLYQWLVRDRITASESDAKHLDAARLRFNKQRVDLVADLKQTLIRTTDRVAEAETIRMNLRVLPVVHRHDDDAALRGHLVAEIRAIDEQLARPRIHPSILERHAECVTRLRTLTSQGHELSGLAAVASEHLRKLSGGRMNSIFWKRNLADGAGSGGVEIDGRAENSCDTTQRFIAALAVRLAAADELARRGRGLPVIVETPSLRHLSMDGFNQEFRSLLQSGVAALAQCTRNGRQVVLLTDDAVIADQVMRAGGSVHTIGSSVQSASVQTDYDQEPSRLSVPADQVSCVNRDFDVAWQEANSDESPAAVQIEPLRTWDDTTRSTTTSQTNGRAEATDIPFFLTGRSPINQAPSINAQQAERLHAVGVQQIEQLLAASPKQLAGSLGLEDVDAGTVRRWQHECRLVCGVRKMRSFDARVLVGCGITHPRELAEIDAKTLVERVEAFMATDRGGRILRSGSDEEISRLTDWINQARGRGASSLPHRSETKPHRSETKQVPREYQVSEPRVACQTSPERVLGVESKPRRNIKTNEATQKFHLTRNSIVEAGPSIGPRMAERLHRIGVKTVGDLVSRPAASIADALKLAKVDAALVRQWQQQATLVCRVPMLRGHDAQLLVAAGITEPERLAECEAGWLLNQIEPIARSREGKAILRGGKLPEIDEMREWINNARQNRELVAA